MVSKIQAFFTLVRIGIEIKKASFCINLLPRGLNGELHFRNKLTWHKAGWIIWNVSFQHTRINPLFPPAA